MPEEIKTKLPDDWVDQPESPPNHKDYGLRLKGFEQWRFTLRIPSLPEYTSLIQKMSKMAGIAPGEFLEKMDEFLPLLSEIAAALTTRWNFLDVEGRRLPVPAPGSATVVNQLRSDVAWDYLTLVSDFAGELQAGGRGVEEQKKF